jgi:GxxExxY protein
MGDGCCLRGSSRARSRLSREDLRLAYCLELDSRGIKFEREKKIDVRYKQWVIPGQRIDLVVEGLVLGEIKAVPKLLNLHERQVRSYLKTMGLRAGLLVNFNTVLVKNGMRRIVST